MKEFRGTLRGPNGTAACIVRVDERNNAYMDDADVKPSLPDGEYDLEVNGINRPATRYNSLWKASEY
jgi:hypothetical protein